MALTPRFTMNDIHAYVNAGIAAIEKAVIATLQRRGEQFVKECRSQSGSGSKPYYRDRSGNLRSSIGYFILDGNEIIAENFEGDAEGQAAAKAIVSEVEKKDGLIRLIGVAGMNYAAALESKGYNVITNQVLQIIPLIKGDFESLQRKIKSL